MDTLENQNNSKRLQRAIILSIMAYFVWLTWFTPVQVPVQQAPQNETKSNEAGIVPAAGIDTPEKAVESEYNQKNGVWNQKTVVESKSNQKHGVWNQKAAVESE